MKSTLAILVFVVLCSFSQAIPRGPWHRPPPVKPPQDQSTLKLVHALWRHGNRNPESGSIWEGNAYTNESYYPEGFGQLTNAGKLTEYNLGKLLRKRYDSFLGDIWNINLVDFRSTAYNRTKMSGLLVMAGLWPPKGRNVWSNELNWQPIPYNYADSDAVILPFGCPTYTTWFNDVYSSSEIQSYLSERYAETMAIVSENTGIDVDDYYSAFSYYDSMKVQTDIGFPLDEWTAQVYPEPLQSLAVDMYYIWTNTTSLRQLLAGSLVKKILADSQSLIDGTLSPSSRKLFAYSAHDLNVGSAILSLEAYKFSQTPPYGATVIFELHQIEDVWGLKLFYVDYTEGSPHPLSIPGCDHFCPIDQFYSLVEEILPTSDVCNAS